MLAFDFHGDGDYSSRWCLAVRSPLLSKKVKAVIGCGVLPRGRVLVSETCSFSVCSENDKGLFAYSGGSYS